MDVKLTPGMEQYMKVKNEHPDCIVLFRMGDFYETFFEDAKLAAKELEITLTSRGKGESRAPLAGIPYHSIDPYIAKLIKKGYKVAIVEQVEDPRLAKGLVKRDLVRIITPGTVVESMILDEGSNNYLLSFVLDKENAGLAFCDISTGEFFAAEISREQLVPEMRKLNPAEVVYPLSLEESGFAKHCTEMGFLMHSSDDRFFSHEKSKEVLKRHFGVIDFSGFGVQSQMALSAAGALLQYIESTQMMTLKHMVKLQQYRTDSSMYLDAATVRNLELLRNIMTQKEEGTLLHVLDKTVTPMGKRRLKKWITSPLLSQKEIEERLDAVEFLRENIVLRSETKLLLDGMYDMERLIGRVSFGNANPKDLIALKHSLEKIPQLRRLFASAGTALLAKINSLPDVEEPRMLIQQAIKDDPHTLLREGNIIRKGFHAELDELREIQHHGKQYLAEMEEKEREKTGIKSLKISYNKVFGYFIEVTKANLHAVPSHYIRKQTQVNAERFITEDLKEMESKILGAEERILALEFDLFMGVLEKLKGFITPIQECSELLSVLDCVLSFAEVAHHQNYVRPYFGEKIEIIDGRHPVIEAFSDVRFVPNSCSLDRENRTMIITGPNMAGKSTYMRQIALLCLMAQCGSFVPARTAVVPVLDRIFTRVGAYDDLVAGQSTFMVEMTETAQILHDATDCSLVIVDEVGRGTSTYDGLSLAWAIAEHLHAELKAYTLFATHYHHLNALSEKYPGIRNFNVAVQETKERIVFLRKIIPGGTDKSYGIEVARLAGIPSAVIDGAKRIMSNIEIEDEVGEMLLKELKKPEELQEQMLRKPEGETKDSTLLKFV